VRSTLVADTSVVFAALVRDDSDHEACSELMRAGDTVVVPSAVIVEVGLLGRSRGRPEAADELLGSVADGTILTFDPDREDYARIRHLVRQYADLPLDIVDASVVAVAERLEERRIATLDHRHFSVVRPAHVEAFTLVP